ncbi:MAG: hypothetical protein GF329_14560 [Candidatus Lokiarchaeota archaeon]|nr:hypothetical protein [Candidatus Lokiarchaeota archaeon]
MALKEFFQDYKKMTKIFGIVSLILLVIFLLGGFFSNFLFESMIICLGIILALFGYVGGVWLWSVLAESERIVEMKNLIRIVGIFGLIALFGVVGFGIFMYFQPETVLRTSIFNLNFLLLFMLFYLLGYDYSIMRSEGQRDIQKVADIDGGKSDKKEEKGLFTIDWEIVKQVGSAIIVVILLVFFPLLMTGIYGNMVGTPGNELAIMMELFLILLICILGFGIAYLFWEHLKQSGLIQGGFKKQLIILSIGTTIVAIFLLVYGIYSIDYGVFLFDTVGTYTDLRNIVISITLFMDMMAFYFLGLFISVLLIKDTD